MRPTDMKLAIVALFTLFASTAVAAPDPQMREQRREQRRAEMLQRFDHNRDGRLDRQEKREAKQFRREHRRERQMRRHQREQRREQREQRREQRQFRQDEPAYMNPLQAPGAQ